MESPWSSALGQPLSLGVKPSMSRQNHLGFRRYGAKKLQEANGGSEMEQANSEPVRQDVDPPPSWRAPDDVQRSVFRWLLLALFGGAFALSLGANLLLLFLVGFGEVTLPNALLIPLGVATVGNTFPGLVYILIFAFQEAKRPQPPE